MQFTSLNQYFCYDAIDVFCYDPEAAPGRKFSVLAKSNIRRMYHSSTVLLPDARTLIMGTDQATYDPATSYEHRVEAFTPPWLLNGTPRPVITRYSLSLLLVVLAADNMLTDLCDLTVRQRLSSTMAPDSWCSSRER